GTLTSRARFGVTGSLPQLPQRDSERRLASAAPAALSRFVHHDSDARSIGPLVLLRGGSAATRGRWLRAAADFPFEVERSRPLPLFASAGYGGDGASPSWRRKSLRSQ